VEQQRSHRLCSWQDGNSPSEGVSIWRYADTQLQCSPKTKSLTAVLISFQTASTFFTISSRRLKVRPDLRTWLRSIRATVVAKRAMICGSCFTPEHMCSLRVKRR
jgi:hypothetical protein